MTTVVTLQRFNSKHRYYIGLCNSRFNQAVFLADTIALNRKVSITVTITQNIVQVTTFSSLIKKH